MPPTEKCYLLHQLKLAKKYHGSDIFWQGLVGGEVSVKCKERKFEN